ncbi:xanthine dehydrogenase family protein molybdopterin-binding subunit [Variovorax sp. SRS16]|uniref:xanthine dehydrogenase family protein molybdopterin-binding subunit n=1 Tax=Variovorax sp. SRS16 TaxID=282217 RepID=UPI0013A59BAA|nr:xanthine dehydrogenase family protein molybdopterin-binding subunit [Variovorax sp. SRS16]
MGESLPRREDAWLLRGAGRFVDDVEVPRNTIHLTFVLSPEPHARVKAVDVTAARALAGVIDVLPGSEVAKLLQPLETRIEAEGYRSTARDAVAVDRVRFVGESVAVVLAETPYIAQDAADLVLVDYEELPKVCTAEEATMDNAPLVHASTPDNVLFEARFETPDFPSHAGADDEHLEETFRAGRVTAVSIEPRGCLAIPERGDGSLTFYTSTQVPHIVRTAIAESTGLSESKIRVITPDVGGGFGMKAHVYPEEHVAAALALKYRRAVKWIQDRREDLLTSAHARDAVFTLKAVFRRDGTIVALEVDCLSNAGAYSSYPYGCQLEPLGSVRMMLGPYAIPNYKYRIRAVATNTCPTGAYRGTGQPNAFFAIEGMMDRIARKLGLDPAAVRRCNMIREDQLPFENAIGIRFDAASFTRSFDLALQVARYAEYRAAQTRLRLEDGKYRGIGIANFTEVSGIGSRGWRIRGVSRVPGFDAATLRMEPSGSITACISQAAAGQGHLTTFAQLVADCTGARIEDIAIVEGDTGLTPYGSGAIASRSAVASGSAVILAAGELTAKLKRIAGVMLEVSPDDIVLKNGAAEVMGVPGHRVPFRRLAETAYSMNSTALPAGTDFGLTATSIYDPPAAMANAVHIAFVSVDAQDGCVEIERYVVVHDCGRIINPAIVNGQIRGGVAQGLGQVLMEGLVYDGNGQLLNANLLDYLLPTAMDVPNIDIHHIETPGLDSPGGFKGVGEGGVIGAVPAIANAVADALAGVGVNINALPLRPSLVLGRLQSASQPRS